MSERKSILPREVNKLIDEALRVTGIGKSPHYSHRRAWKKLRSKPSGFKSLKLVQDLYGCIENNWLLKRRHTDASKENWRLKPCTKISKRNTSSEVKLERSIADLKDEAWPANQVPVASGLFSPHADKRCAIDLVYRCPDHAAGACYALIELKTESNSPLYAAFEILLYGLIYLLSKCHAQDLGYTAAGQPLLHADSIHLRVLAPQKFYDEGPKLEWLERSLNQGISTFSKQFGVKMDFAFLVLRLDIKCSRQPIGNGAKYER